MGVCKVAFLDLSNAKWIDAPLKIVNPIRIIKNNSIINEEPAGSYLSGLSLHNGNRVTFLDKEVKSGIIGTSVQTDGGYAPAHVLGGFYSINTPAVNSDVYDLVMNVEVGKVSEIFPYGHFDEVYLPNWIYRPTGQGYLVDVLISYWNFFALPTKNQLVSDYSDWYYVKSCKFYNRKENENFPRISVDAYPSIIFDLTGYTYSVYNGVGKYSLRSHKEDLTGVIQLTFNPFNGTSPITPGRFLNNNIFGLAGKIAGYDEFQVAFDASPIFDGVCNAKLVYGIRNLTSQTNVTFSSYGKIRGKITANAYTYSPNSVNNPILAFKTLDDIKLYCADFGVKCLIDDEYSARNTPQEDIPLQTPEDTFTPSTDVPTFGFPSSVVEYIPSYPDNTSDTIELITPTISPLMASDGYILNTTKTKELFTWLLTDDYTKNVSELFGDKISPIVSLKLYPFDFYEHDSAHLADVGALNIGGVQSEIDAPILAAGYNTIFDGGNITLSGYFGNFLDFTNCAYALYVPYVGIIELSPSDVVNREISLKYILDFGSGSATAIIYSNGVLIKTLPAMVGIDIPILYSNANEIKIANTIENLNLATSVFSSIGGGVAAAASGDIGGAIGGVLGGGISFGVQKYKNSLNDQIKTSAVGGFGISTSLSMPQEAFFIVTRQRAGIPADYGKIAGYPTAYSGVLNDFVGAGFVSVRAENVNGISATENEITEIQTLLANGIFI